MFTNKGKSTNPTNLTLACLQPTKRSGRIATFLMERRELLVNPCRAPTPMLGKNGRFAGTKAAAAAAASLDVKADSRLPLRSYFIGEAPAREKHRLRKAGDGVDGGDDARPPETTSTRENFQN